MKNVLALLLILSVLILGPAAGRNSAADEPAAEPLAGMGIMVGEVTSSSALVQVRLTAADRLVEGDVPGAAGVVEFVLRPVEGPDEAAAASEASRELGIEWCLGRMVVAVDADGVTLDDGQRIASHTVIWTVGFRASALTEQINAPRDHQGRLQVDSQLKVQGQPAIFAAGDTACAATDDAGNFSVMSCQHAIALGRHAGNNAAAELIGVAATHYSQPKYVTCLDLGAWGAVYPYTAELFPTRLRSSAFGMVEGFGKGAAIGGPYLFGALIDRTGDTVWSLVFVALVMVAGAVATLFGRETRGAKLT